MTALSSRLSHLLIHPDPSTGNLIMPDGRRLPPLNLDHSPPLSPLWPEDKRWGPSDIPKLLPPPRTPTDNHRPSTSLFSLLNNYTARPPTPPDASTPKSRERDSVTSSHRALSHHHQVIAPSLAPRPEQRPGSAYHHAYEQRSAGPIRPESTRRHTQPYVHSRTPYQRPYTAEGSTHTHRYVTDEYRPQTVMAASRAPISRTTKACNAYRSRKVRCDAGGLPNGEPGTCSRCREAGVECVYSGPQKKRGPCPG